MTADRGRNNPVLGYLAMGDGWHSNHRRAPYSAHHGFAWYEFDITYQLIRTLSPVGLVWGVKRPSLELRAGRGSGDSGADAAIGTVRVPVPGSSEYEPETCGGCSN